MLVTYKYKPITFFLLSFFISWIPWFFAIYASYNPLLQHLLLPSIVIGLAGPMVSTLIMLIKAKDKDLWEDFFKRLHPKSIKKSFIPVSLFLPLSLILFAVTLSLFFGQSVDQFSLLATRGFDAALQGINVITILFILCLIGPFEEIGWRAYGIDSLRNKFNLNLMTTSVIFGAIWGVWHLPMFLVKNGAFQQDIWNHGLFHTAVYFTVLFLISIITNWLYIKNNRSILIAILFHSSYDLCIQLFHITPITWCILALLLLLTSIVIIVKDIDIFF